MAEFELKVPDSPVCAAAMELVRDASPRFLFNHVMRTFGFGSVAGQRMGQSYDAEMLFLGSVMHDLGLVEKFIGDDRFEVDGADAAADFLSRQGYPDAKISIVWDAIALHTTGSIPQRKQAEIALVQIGAGIDVGVVPQELLTPKAIDALIEAYPRLGFKKSMLETLKTVVERKPMTAMHTFLADVGHDCVHGFEVPNFCDALRGAGFAE